MEVSPEMKAAREALAARMGNTTMGGGVRRKAKSKPSQTNAQDDKKLHAALKRIYVQQIPGIEEANLFREDGKVIHFRGPKVQAAVHSNVFIISGNAHEKTQDSLMPGIAAQLGNNSDQMEQLRQLLMSAQAQAKATGKGDDDVPELEGNFDA